VEPYVDPRIPPLYGIGALLLVAVVVLAVLVKVLWLK
jgi:hypothetical protein